MKATTFAFGTIAVIVGISVAEARPCVESPSTLVSCVTVDRESDVILSVTVDDEVQNRALDAVAALSVRVDDQSVEELLIFPGTGRRLYDAVVGPLLPGRHEVSLQPSAYWPAPKSRVHGLNVRTVRETDSDYLLVRHAPAIWARADTIGQATDLLLTMFVERTDETVDSTTLVYSSIFSNEDGGTSTRALMARWGRTTDIEWMYRVRLSSGRTTGEQYQAANHDTRAFEGAHLGSHPLVLVATLNNVFADRGRTPVLFRPVPRGVDLATSTRESVMDAEPWMYRVMSRELAAEGKIRENGHAATAVTVDDPRSYVFVEGELTLRNAAAAATVQYDQGTWRASHLGMADLAVARNEFVRVAVPGDGKAPRAVGWTCLARTEPSPSESPPGEATCRVRLVRAFRLDSEYRVQPIALEPTEFQLSPGEMRAVSVTAQPH